jgi:hypothetical protein
MGSLPQHSLAEFRRYMNRFVYLFPNLSNMTHILRTPLCQYQAFVVPLLAWVRQRGVNVLTGVFVHDIGFAPSPDRITVERSLPKGVRRDPNPGADHIFLNLNKLSGATPNHWRPPPQGSIFPPHGVPRPPPADPRRRRARRLGHLPRRRTAGGLATGHPPRP